jgi:hypothetical protein
VEQDQDTDTILGTMYVNDTKSLGVSFQRNHCRCPYRTTYCTSEAIQTYRLAGPADNILNHLRRTSSITLSCTILGNLLSSHVLSPNASSLEVNLGTANFLIHQLCPFPPLYVLLSALEASLLSQCERQAMS